jgi:hypothetical protein
VPLARGQSGSPFWTITDVRPTTTSLASSTGAVALPLANSRTVVVTAVPV